MKKIKFHKYVAAGNDFLLFNGLEFIEKDYNNLALRACNRHFGIGADGIMVCEKSHIGDIKMVYYNSDGSQGEMCGNGIRSFAKYIYDNNIIRNKSIAIETLAGIKLVDIEEDNFKEAKTMAVQMGRGEEILLDRMIQVDSVKYSYSSLILGVPHVVIFVEDIRHIDINQLGRKIEVHEFFPKRTNVNFIEVKNRSNINIYTWERGAGRTLACGTGASASVLVGNLLDKLDKKVDVKTEGGRIGIEIKDDMNLIMTGGARLIAYGDYIY